MILITGGLGYVGTVLVPMMAERYPVRVYDSMMFGNAIAGTPNVEFVKGDIRDGELLREAMKGVTGIAHLAGVVTDELVAMNPAKAREINAEGTRLLCEEAARARVQRLVYASSSSIYGTQTEGDEANEETEPKPMSEYARQKLDGERICMSYASAMTVVAVRAATASGPAPRMRLDTIVNTFCAQAYFNQRISVWGGDQWRNNIHIRDMADFYAFLLEQPLSAIRGKVWNISAGNHRALDLAEMVSRIIPARIDVDLTRPDRRHYRMDARRVTMDLGWSSAFTLEDAIRDNLAFFKGGEIREPNNDLYFNNRRMAKFMRTI